MRLYHSLDYNDEHVNILWIIIIRKTYITLQNVFSWNLPNIDPGVSDYSEANKHYIKEANDWKRNEARYC